MTKRPIPNRRLKRAREARNWTQADVANRVGTSRLTVSRWELGVQSPVPHLRGKLCELFEMDPEQLGLLSDDSAVSTANDGWQLRWPEVTAFVGRETELHRLGLAMSDASAARGGLILLS